MHAVDFHQRRSLLTQYWIDYNKPLLNSPNIPYFPITDKLYEANFIYEELWYLSEDQEKHSIYNSQHISNVVSLTAVNTA